MIDDTLQTAISIAFEHIGIVSNSYEDTLILRKF